jgi:hypothetical protein
MTLRCQFDLLPQDQQFLDEYGLSWETIVDGSQWVLIHNFPTLHEGYNQESVTAAIRLETGYPITALDMVYFDPPLARKDGRAIGATEATQQIDGRTFQRWSRHRTEVNPWKPGQDSIGSHVILIEDWLAREFERCPLP